MTQDASMGTPICERCDAPIILDDGVWRSTCRCISAAQAALDLQATGLYSYASKRLKFETTDSQPPPAEDLTKDGYKLVQIVSRPIGESPYGLTVYRHVYEYRKPIPDASLDAVEDVAR